VNGEDGCMYLATETRAVKKERKKERKEQLARAPAAPTNQEPQRLVGSQQTTPSYNLFSQSIPDHPATCAPTLPISNRLALLRPLRPVGRRSAVVATESTARMTNTAPASRSRGSVWQSPPGLRTVRAKRDRSSARSDLPEDDSLIACDLDRSRRYYMQSVPVHRPPRPQSDHRRHAATPPAPDLSPRLKNIGRDVGESRKVNESWFPLNKPRMALAVPQGLPSVTPKPETHYGFLFR